MIFRHEKQHSHTQDQLWSSFLLGCLRYPLLPEDLLFLIALSKVKKNNNQQLYLYKFNTLNSGVEAQLV